MRPQHALPRTALEALAAVKGTVLFTRNRLGKPPEQIRVTDLLAIVDELMDEQRKAEAEADVLL